MVRTIGAQYLGNQQCAFAVWAPFAETMSLLVVSPEKKSYPLSKDDAGYWNGTFDGIPPGALYYYMINNELKRPDPASGAQPEGVHGPSKVIDHAAFKWEDQQWYCIPLSELIIYELHTGTFTQDGSFKGISERIDYIKQLGINAIEIMPIAQFPGSRNWGYDGVFPFAVQSTYGTPNELKTLINECHKAGIAVILDVVYNHLGPEGNYLHDFGPYFTGKYHTPWGKAINFDDAYCDHVRNFFISNALMWFHHYHFDGLRLDAVHAMLDTGAKHFLKELAEAAAEQGVRDERKYFLIAESDLNDIRVIGDPATGGYGIHCQWSDDFHHALHALATGESSGYYADFGKPGDLVKAFNETFVYDWQYSPFRKKTFGSSAVACAPNKFVVCSQNHDQVGNRMLGERLTQLVSFEMLKLVAGAVLISPNIPMLFMGEEYGESAPFQYFISHTDEGLIEAVRKGRAQEFAAFKWQGEVPDPQANDTFERSKLTWKMEGKNKVLLEYYRFLIALRREKAAAKSNLVRDKSQAHQYHDMRIFIVIREGDQPLVCFLNFEKAESPCLINTKNKELKKIIDSADTKWGGSGSVAPDRVFYQQEISLKPESIVIYEMV